MATFGMSNAKQKMEEERKQRWEAKQKKQAEKDKKSKEKYDKNLKMIQQARVQNGLKPLEFGREPEHRFPKEKEAKK